MLTCLMHSDVLAVVILGNNAKNCKYKGADKNDYRENLEMVFTVFCYENWNTNLFVIRSNIIASQGASFSNF